MALPICRPLESLCPGLTYGAFACLPNRERYQTISDIEKHLSYDEEAIWALYAASKQPSTHRGAWNLLLLALGRTLAYYAKTEELGDLLKWLILAIDKKKHPVSFLRSYAYHHKKSRESAAQRESEYFGLFVVRGSLSIAYDGEGLVWSTAAQGSDFFLRERIDKALKKLTKHQRTIFLLRLEGHTSPEIAALLNTTESNINSRFCEARKKLKKALSAVDPRKG